MSSKFSITYFPYPYFDSKAGVIKEVFKPTVPIRIGFNRKFTDWFQALVDSGSDKNLFPAELGELVGIDIKNVKVRPVYGIGGVKINSYTHKINLNIEKCNFETEVDFSYEQKFPLLGRFGFFDQFRSIEFREKQRKIEFSTS